MKICPKCEDMKASSEFHKHCARPDGLQSYCRKCQHAIRTERRKSKVVVSSGQVERSDAPETPPEGAVLG